MTPSHVQLDDILSQRIEGTHLQNFWYEFFTNSGTVLILKLLTDLTVYGAGAVLTDFADWIFLLAMLTQTWLLSQTHVPRFWGNLVGMSIYTLVDWPLDGAEFWSDLNHQVFWCFIILIGGLQSCQKTSKFYLKRLVFLLESVLRSLLILAVYVVINKESQALEITHIELKKFFAINGHEFLIWSSICLGLLLGLQTLQIDQQRQRIRETTKILRNLAEWGMGRHAVTAAVSDPSQLDFQRCDRALVFMDIRGFTNWCEVTAPRRVAEILNVYYRAVEPAATQAQPLKVALTADEIMAIYTTPEQAIAAACAMQQAAQTVLAPLGLGAGCGVHWGSTIEGLFGSDGTRTYTTIGDTVNTAKRIESHTPAGEITISDAVYQNLHGQIPSGYQVQARSPIQVKGKTQPLIVWTLVLESTSR